VNDIVRWLQQRAAAATARGFVVGLSGGIDSAVVARLCQLATPGQVAGVIMPCRSDPRDEADAGLVADAFSIPTLRVDLEPSYEALVADARGALETLAPEMRPAIDDGAGRIALGNVRPRLRMATLYFIANSLNYLVAGTGNRSELTIGYFTKHGDGGVDILPIGHLLKSQVRALAKELGVPQPIIDKAPSAGLWAGQTDEAEMGFSYADLERYLTDGPEGVSPALALRLERMIRATEHKRDLPPTPEL
jgi:NAD+ synthase